MSNCEEEQELECQALEAIFDTNFNKVSNNEWTIDLYPNHNDDNDTSNEPNHVGCQLHVILPIDYPEISLPIISIRVLKGLIDEHCIEILQIANEEAEANATIPCMYAIAERIKEWLYDHNQPGLDDISMHAIMLRKEKEKELKIEKEKQLKLMIQTVRNKCRYLCINMCEFVDIYICFWLIRSV